MTRPGSHNSKAQHHNILARHRRRTALNKPSRHRRGRLASHQAEAGSFHPEVPAPARRGGRLRHCRRVGPGIEHGGDHRVGNALLPQIHDIGRAQIVDGARTVDVSDNGIIAHVGVRQFQDLLHGGRQRHRLGWDRWRRIRGLAPHSGRQPTAQCRDRQDQHGLIKDYLLHKSAIHSYIMSDLSARGSTATLALKLARAHDRFLRLCGQHQAVVAGGVTIQPVFPKHPSLRLL